VAQEKILDMLPSDELRLYVVWTPVLREDNRAAAVEAMTLITGERVTHFWDADKSLGLAFGTVVDLPRDRTLGWDVYFVFDRDLEWGDGQPPIPTEWMHQLGTDERLLDGLKLHESVKTLLKANPNR
jgi:hypothetical protein